MDSRKKGTWLAALLIAVCLVVPLAPSASAQEGLLVGRIAYMEGQVLRYVPESRDWVATVKDAPFGMHDALYSDPNARAEFILPNGLWVRIGASTQIQLIALKSDASDIDVASGVTRFYNISSTGVVKATTPFGSVLAEPQSTFDLYVGDESVEVLALKGDVAFLHQATNARYDVLPGRSSIIANATEVAAGDGTVDAAWDDWNAARDRLWAHRTRTQSASVRHLPPQLLDSAYALDDNGRWERVYYEGDYYEFWRPTTVAATWQPFTVGRWTDWYGDQTWVPDEPFGYVTHHYGNWVVVHGIWYWAPPVATVTVTTGPLLGLAWYPGRVAWIHSAVDIGWVPLAPTEIYYAHRAWGPRAVVVATVPTVSINIGSLAFAHAAVVVPQRTFYSVPTYTSVRVTQINRTMIVNNFRPAPVINQTVIHNYPQLPNKYNFTNVQVTQKPHNEVVTRITRNQQMATQQAPAVNAATLKQTLATTRPAEPARQAAVPPPTLSNRLVPAHQVQAPRHQVQFQPVEIKQQSKPATASPAVQPAPGPRPGAPAPQPGQPLAPGAPRVPRVPPQAPGPATPRRSQPTPPISPRLGTPGGQPLPGAPGTLPGAPGIQSPRPGGQPPAIQPPPRPTPQAPAQPQLQPPPRLAPQAPPAMQPRPRLAPQPPPQQQQPPRSAQPPAQQQIPPLRPTPQAPPAMQPQPRPAQPPPAMQPRPRLAPQPPPQQQQPPRSAQPPAQQQIPPPRPTPQAPPAMQPQPRPAQPPPAMQPRPRLAPQPPPQQQQPPRSAQPPAQQQIPPPRPTPQAPPAIQPQPRPAQPPPAMQPPPRLAPQPPPQQQQPRPGQPPQQQKKKPRE